MALDKQQIEAWVGRGTISREQAEEMLADVVEAGKERSSSNFVVALSTIGAILLGVGAILFVASNWQEMSNLIKTALLVIATLGSYSIGYYFKYVSKSLPKVGGALVFLGALLFGATIFLVAQMYHVNANSHTLLLVWLVGILPLVYGLATSPMAALSALIFFVWLGFFMLNRLVNARDFDIIRLVPLFYLSAGIFVFGIGAFHYLSERLAKVARTYRLFGIKITMLALFLLTFEFFSGKPPTIYYNTSSLLAQSSEFATWFLIFSIAAILLSFAMLFFNPAKSKTNQLESGVPLALLALGLLLYFFPVTTAVYTVIFNLLMAAIIIAIIYIGYQREDMPVVNTGLFWLAALIIARYFDFFWDLLERSVFFMVGGLILVLGGIALERKRRQIKASFIKTP